MRIPGERQVPLKPQHGHRNEALGLRGLPSLVDEQVGEEFPVIVNGRVRLMTGAMIQQVRLSSKDSSHYGDNFYYLSESLAISLRDCKVYHSSI